MLAVVAPAYVAALRRSRLRCAVVLVYHELVDQPPATEQVVPVVTVRDFERQLAWLGRRFDVVAEDDVRAAAARRAPGGRIPAAITFDDDLASHRTKAMPALSSHGFPAAFFLNGSWEPPAPVYWWQALQRVADAGLLAAFAQRFTPWSDDPPRTLTAAATRLEALREQGKAEAVACMASLVDVDASAARLSGDQARELVQAGHSVGFHTRGHPVLTALDPAALDGALGAGRDVVERAAGRPLTALAYPHGKADGRVAAAARAVGFQRAYTTAGVAMRDRDDELLLPRVSVAGGSADLALQVGRSLRAARRG